MFSYADRTAGVLERARDAMTRLDPSDVQAADAVRALADQARSWLERVGQGRSADRAQQAMSDSLEAAADVLSDVRDRMRGGWRSANDGVRGAASSVRDVAVQGRDWAGEHPMQTVLVAGAIGFLVAVLIARSRSDAGNDDRGAGW